MPAHSQDTEVILARIDAMDARHRANEDAKHAENRQQIEAILGAQRKLQHDVEGITKGFPDGDPDSHRRYHESIIEWRELRNRIVREALLNAAKVGGLGAIGWIAYALWKAFLMEITK